MSQVRSRFRSDTGRNRQDKGRTVFSLIFSVDQYLEHDGNTLQQRPRRQSRARVAAGQKGTMRRLWKEVGRHLGSIWPLIREHKDKAKEQRRSTAIRGTGNLDYLSSMREGRYCATESQMISFNIEACRWRPDRIACGVNRLKSRQIHGYPFADGLSEGTVADIEASSPEQPGGSDASAGADRNWSISCGPWGRGTFVGVKIMVYDQTSLMQSIESRWRSAIGSEISDSHKTLTDFKIHQPYAVLRGQGAKRVKEPYIRCPMWGQTTSHNVKLSCIYCNELDALYRPRCCNAALISILHTPPYKVMYPKQAAPTDFLLPTLPVLVAGTVIQRE